MTTESSSAFFTDPSNSALIRRLIQDLRLIAADAIQPEGLTDNLEKVLEIMIGYPEEFDKFAAVNIKWIGRSFIGEINNFFMISPEKRYSSVSSIFTNAYRFLCEFEFTRQGEPSFEITNIMNFVHNNLEAFSGMDRQQLVYATYTMPVQVAKKLIGHPSVIDFRKFSETVEESRKLKEQWDSDIKSRQELIQGLSENLSKVASNYNFVGLVHGFQSLKRDKEGSELSPSGRSSR